jgi:hypothetical protein
MNIPYPEGGNFAALEEKIRAAAQKSLFFAAKTVQSAVIDFTPRWKGGLQSNILIRPSDGGNRQTVYATGVVANVMEAGGTWTKWPPHKPILEWVEGKLGLSGKDAKRAAFFIRRKIFRFGIKIPLKFDGRGAMFGRAFARMRATKAHFLAFSAAFRSKVLSGG